MPISFSVDKLQCGLGIVCFSVCVCVCVCVCLRVPWFLAPQIYFLRNTEILKLLYYLAILMGNINIVLHSYHVLHKLALSINGNSY
jgi:hypothetical protein